MRLAFLCALAGVWIGYAAAEPLTAREVVSNLPRGWKLEKEAKAEELIKLSIALKQPRMDELKARLDRISNKTSAEYGYHLTRDEARAYQEPDKVALEMVHSWLMSAGITDVIVDGSLMTVTSTVAKVNEILDTTLGYYSFQERSPVLRAQSYSLPFSLDGAVELIYPISNFMPPPQSRLKSTPSRKASAVSTLADDQPCSGGVKPACLISLYNVTHINVTTPIKSPIRFGIAGFLEQWIKYEDVSEFLGRYSPELGPLNYTFTIATANNGTNPQPNTPDSRAGLEASLDVEYAMALGYPVNVIYYSTGGRGEKVDPNGDLLPSNRSDNEPYLEFVQYLLDLNDEEIPHIISISYADDEQSVPISYATRVCDLFAILAARGVSILSGSGDGGASGIGQNQCYSNDGQRRRMFLPTFPASCPYVTAVGATGNTLPLEGADFSTGGFSNYFARPEWQKEAVDGYILAINGSHRGLYNETGRAFPDISATGTNYVIQVGGYETDVLGTSASTPVVAALIALVNESRLKAGKNSTGWLNPVLYSQPVREALQDVTAGVSQSCLFDEEKEPGWESVKGYDCVTGLGSALRDDAYTRFLNNMPILEVKPTSSELLQHVANSLGKARKVVIITGAGISTNSGIPDFRSENGLYSLIQAQFERAEASHPKDAEGQSASFASSGRPTKRRRISRTAECSTEQEEPKRVTRASNDCKNLTSYARDGLRVKPEVETLSSKTSLQRLAHSRPGLRPILHRHITQTSTSTESSTSQDSSFSTPQLSSASSQTEESSLCEVKETRDGQARATTPRAILSETFSSSPLSSPPPILFDPYEHANLSTESSDTSDSEETQNSLDLFSSQTSTSSLRNMKGRDLFDCNIWADPLKTSVFYRFATTLRQKVKEVEPTTTHRFIAQLRDVGKLARVYTQNIDEIEKKIGLSTDLKNGAGNRRRKSAKHQVTDSEKDFKENQEPPKNEDDPNRVDTGQASQNSEVSGRSNTRSVLAPDRGVECVFLHGSLNSLRCFVCGKLCNWDEDGRESCTMLGEQPECPHCAGATAARQEKGKRALGVGKLRPDIVLYGEEHPQSDLISPIVQHDLSAGPDLLLILGTSLRVHGLKVMVKEFAKAVHNKGGRVIFINLTKPSESAWGDIIDYWIEWDCDAWVDDLKNRKPHLWLSPDEILESEKQRREALAEKKKENLFKKRESIAEKKRESLGEKRRHTIALDKPRPPPKNPSSMRNDYQCGAYVVWEIFQTLAKIGNRPFDNLGYKPPQQPPPAAPPPVLSPAVTSQPRPAITKAKKARKSAPAALVAPTDSETKSRPAVKAKFLTTCASRNQYAKAAQELARSGKSPTPVRMAELNRAAMLHGKKTASPYTPPSSITAAVKIHPRQRKRKLIEGVPVSLPISRIERPRLPLSTPLQGIRREVEAENRLAPTTTYSTLPSKGPILPPFHPGWERSPPARIKPLEPSLNVSPRSPLANLPPIVQPKVFARRQATHPMFFSDPLVKLRYETTNYRKPPKDADAVIYDKTPSPSDQLRWELAQQEALEGAQALEGLKRSR
ncbi:DHS-like NAD/FAD-binding domain-containing protein [Annulohypoxylon truncatum]|uniref:DHS-like NAD/FAD-binding domain-containing protein n=1 Tax=Annulohypoxylon truncatum TaxID=327061 RepID=UPI0020074218|nr:DHS-like NAD/FAD-binding domain-containing protein [Annulohypoxylon truncatum]KAI1206089.1 DHS-like NAD/FAD-binding domain-containing protein [Annulohypoxylon truncatum]